MSDVHVVIDPPERTDAEPIDVPTHRRRDPEQGFSLIELIIVIVILGILVAIAIPIYNNIQDNAKDNALKTAAANGASQAVAQLANGTAVGSIDLTNLQSGEVKSVTIASGDSPDNICVKASDGGNRPDQYAGPGCPSGAGGAASPSA